MSKKTSAQCLTRSPEPFHDSCSPDNQSPGSKIAGICNGAYMDKLYYIDIKYGIKWYKIDFISIGQKVKAIHIRLWSLPSLVERGKLSCQCYRIKDLYSLYFDPFSLWLKDTFSENINLNSCTVISKFTPFRRARKSTHTVTNGTGKICMVPSSQRFLLLQISAILGWGIVLNFWISKALFQPSQLFQSKNIQLISLSHRWAIPEYQALCDLLPYTLKHWQSGKLFKISNSLQANNTYALMNLLFILHM